MAMMTPENFVAHVNHEVARKFATDILNLLGPEKPTKKAEKGKKTKEDEDK